MNTINLKHGIWVMVADGEKPAADVGVGPEGVPAAERLEKGFLHQVIGARRVARERAREAGNVAEAWHGESLEGQWVRSPPAERFARRGGSAVVHPCSTGNRPVRWMVGLEQSCRAGHERTTDVAMAVGKVPVDADRHSGRNDVGAIRASSTRGSRFRL